MNKTIDYWEANSVRYRVTRFGPTDVVIEVTVGWYIYALTLATATNLDRRTIERLWRCDQSGFRIKRAIDEAGCTQHSSSFNL